MARKRIALSFNMGGLQIDSAHVILKGLLARLGFGPDFGPSEQWRRPGCEINFVQKARRQTPQTPTSHTYAYRVARRS